MARHIWTVVCHKASIDSEDNNVSLLEVIELVTLYEDPNADNEGEGAAAPAISLRHQVCTLWMRDSLETPERSYAQIRLQGPDGHEFGGATNPIDLRFHRRTRITFHAQALPYKGPGLYEVLVEHGPEEDGPWSLVASVPIEVRLELRENE